MIRALGWIGVVLLVVFGHLFDCPLCRVASALAALTLIAIVLPRTLRPAIAVVIVIALVLLARFGISALLDALPALIAAFVAWIFARTLRRRRRPLIARAIAAIDGENQLDDAATLMYARRLTWLWAIWQSLLAVFGGVLAMHSRGAFTMLPAWTPTPGVFAALILPLAVVALLLGEFGVRRICLPRAPRHSLYGFTSALVRAWPRLLDD